jgi:hypothetical protein
MQDQDSPVKQEEEANLVDEEKNSGVPSSESKATSGLNAAPRFWWRFDPLETEPDIEICCDGLAVARTSTLSNAQRLCDFLNKTHWMPLPAPPTLQAASGLPSQHVPDQGSLQPKFALPNCPMCWHVMCAKCPVNPDTQGRVLKCCGCGYQTDYNRQPCAGCKHDSGAGEFGICLTRDCFCRCAPERPERADVQPSPDDLPSSEWVDDYRREGVLEEIATADEK